jgi:hypothetical protein
MPAFAEEAMIKRPKTEKTEQRTTIMVVRLTETERELFERDADRRGLQLSSWARMLLLEKIHSAERRGV